MIHVARRAIGSLCLERHERVFYTGRLVAENKLRGFIRLPSHCGNRTETVKAAALLITVQRDARRRNVPSAQTAIKHDPPGLSIIGKKARADAGLPGGLDEAPSRFDFLKDAGRLGRIRQFEDLVGKDETFRSPRKILFENLTGTSPLPTVWKASRTLSKPRSTTAEISRSYISEPFA